MDINTTQKTQEAPENRHVEDMTDTEAERETQAVDPSPAKPAQKRVLKADVDAARRNRPGMRQQPASGVTVGASQEEVEEEEESQGAALPPPPAPPRIWCPPVQRLHDETCEAYSVAPQIPVACTLALSSARIGRTWSIMAKRGWFESANLFISLIGSSGIGKTPVISSYYNKLHNIEKVLQDKWEQENAEYLEKWEKWNKKKKSQREKEVPPQPAEPRKAYIVDDATIESIGYTLKENQRGLQWQVDELSGLIGSMGKYSKGRGDTTRSRLLTLYDCGPWKTTRADASKNIYIRHACVSIFGGIQPEMVPKVFNEEDKNSGFLPRFIFIFAEQEKPDIFSDACLSDESLQTLENITTNLIAQDFNIKQVEGGGAKEVPWLLHLSRDAKNIWVKWYNKLGYETWEGLSGNSTSSWTKKLQAHSLRICLNLHCLEAAAENRRITNIVTPDEMERACLLADWEREMQNIFLLMLSSGGLRRLSPLERVVASVLVEEAARQGDVPEVVIPTARLTQHVNESLYKRGLPNLDTRKIGVLVTGLGMKTRVKTGPKDAQEWARKLSHDDIQRLRSLLNVRPTRDTWVTSK